LEGQSGSTKRAGRKKGLKGFFTRYGLLAGNFTLLLAIGLLVARSSDAGTGLPGAPSLASAQSVASEEVTNPLDSVSSADIAVNVARMAGLPEERAVTNQADTENALLAVAQPSGGLVAKPQIVSTTLKSNKDIRKHVAVGGESAASIAAKYNVTTDSILWSNDLASTAVTAGQTLYIPPEGMNGIVYVVKPGDTPDSLALKYRANKERIIAFNDAEIAGLKPGTRIIIPEGQIVKPVVVSYRGSGTGFPWGGGPIYNGSNGYDYGYCTWYVANRISVPSNWGNANTWDNLAPSSGWIVGTAPRVGAIGQTDRGGFGHVAVVTAVSPDGTQIRYSDMNGIAGWGREGHSDWTSASKYEHYIYR
jgi:surface antigen